MVCQACGASVVDGVHFCSRCGAQVVAAQPMYAAYPQPPVPTLSPRVQRNLQTLGILWCVFGVYRVISGLMGMFFLKVLRIAQFGGFDWPFGITSRHGALLPMWIDGLCPLIAVYTVCHGGLALFVGIQPADAQTMGQDVAILWRSSRC